MRRIVNLLLLTLSIAACSQAPTINENMLRIDGPLPVDFSGSWERDYSRGDDVNGALKYAYYELSRTIPDQGYPGSPGMQRPSSNAVASLYALARLAELITRPDVLTIAQNENEIRIDRDDDFSLLCAFYDGAAKAIQTNVGAEICGWSGEQLVSNLLLPEGLQITHRFDMANDGKHLRIVTTVASTTSRVPFTLRRFYTKFDRPAADFNCVETLTMKRVCSTGDIEL